MKKRLTFIIAPVLLFIAVLPLHSQLSYGGKPAMNDSDFSPGKVIYLLPPEDPVYLEALKSKAALNTSKPLEYATERTVDLDPVHNGEWTYHHDTHIWRAHIISPGAYSLGVLFSEFHLSPQSQVFIYSPGGTHVRGAYTEKNNKDFRRFYVGHTPGEEVIIELQTTDPEKHFGELRIGTISHAFLPVYAEKSLESTGLGASQDCEVDINCQEGDQWQTLKNSVVHISTTRLLCTGTLVNNTHYDGKPYVLTAEHCISQDFNAGSSVFYFGYENSKCDTLDGKKNQSVSGSRIVATGGDLDFTLVRLSEQPPREFDVYFAGWDASASQHIRTFAIHHPNADAKKISIDYDATSTAASVPGDLNDYIISSNYRIAQWDVGTTEGGSSGCPLFNTRKRIIGVLSGGLAVCGDSIGYDDQNDRAIFSLNGNEDDYFSRLNYAYDNYSEWDKQLKHWLDPANTGLTSIGGLSGFFLETGKSTLSGISTYPNPAKGSFRINLPQYAGQDAKVEMYNLAGTCVYSRMHDMVYPLSVHPQGLKSGVYVIRVIAGNQVYNGSVIWQDW